MEKALKYQNISGPRVILFKEDLEQLAELFYSNFDEIEIEADEYKLKDISEINELRKDVIYDFNIRGKSKDDYSDRMTLSISKKSTYIFIQDCNNAKCIGIKNKIDKLLRTRRRILNILDSFRWLTTIYLLLNLSLFSMLYYFRNAFDKTHFIIVFGITCLFLLMLSILTPFLFLFISNSIQLKYSYEKPNFFKRNKDTIIVAIFSAIFGSIATLIVSFIIKRLTNSPNP
jgi:hypothetical protein